MKYMRWSYDDLMCCPEDYLPVIADHARREQEAQEEAQREAERERERIH